MVCRAASCLAYDQADLRPPPQHRIDIDDGDALDVQCRNNLQSTQKRLDLGGNFGLQSPDDHVLPALPAPPSLVEHPEGFAHSRCVPKKNFEASALSAREGFFVGHRVAIVTRSKPCDILRQADSFRSLARGLPKHPEVTSRRTLLWVGLRVSRCLFRNFTVELSVISESFHALESLNERSSHRHLQK